MRILDVKYHIVLWNFYGEYYDKTYPVILDNNKELFEQDLLDESKIILSIIYRDFICEEDRKQELLKLQQKYLSIEMKKNSVIFYDRDKDKMMNNKIEEVKSLKWYENLKDKICNAIGNLKGGGKKNGR